jgi:hypothetical protein
MRWFGESWGAPVCDPTQQVYTPDGEACPVCHKSIREGDQGVEVPYLHDTGEDTLSYHLKCFLIEIGVRT